MLWIDIHWAVIIIHFYADLVNLKMEVEERGPRYNLSKAKWGEFQDRAQNLVEQIDCEGSVDNWNASLILMIHNASCSRVPMKQNPRSHVLVPWWNKECDIAVRNRNRTYRK